MEKDVGSEGVQSSVNTADTVTAPSPGVLSAEHEGKKQIEAAKPVSQLQPEHEEKKQIAAAKSVSQLQTEHEHKKQIEAAKPVSELQLPLVSSSLKHVSPKSRPSPSIDVKDSSPKKQRLCNCNNLRCLKLRHESSKSRSPPNIDVKHSSPKKQRQCNCKFSGCLMLRHESSKSRSPPNIDVKHSSPKKQRQCNCKFLGCLMLYCECFASGVYCDGCNCTKCCNNTGNEAARHEAIESTLERNPNAFRLKVGLSPHGSCENKVEASEATVLGIHDKESDCKNAGDQSNALFTQQAASKGAINGAFGISIFGSPPAYKRKCQEINLGTVAKDPSTTKRAQFPAVEASEATVLGIHDKESDCKNAGDQSNALFTQQAASKGAINGAFGISIFGSPPAYKRKCQEINLGTVAKDPSTTKRAQFPAEEASEATVLGIHDKESHCKNAGDQSNALFTQQAASKGAINGAFGISIFGSPPAYKRKCQEINLGTVAKDPSTTKRAQFPAVEASEATVLGIHDKESDCKNAGDQSNALFTQQAASKGAINGAFGISIFGSPPAYKRKCQEINLGTVAKDPSTTKRAQFPAVVSVLGHQMKNNVWCRDPRKKMSSHYRKQPSFEEATLSQPQWLRQQEVFFINLMAEKVTVGGIYRNPGSFWKDEWLDISKRFYELFGLKHDVSYFIKRLNPLQARLTEFKKLVEDNKGLGWDPILKTVIASPEWWEKYIRNHPGAKKFLHQGCPEYEHLSIIFGETIQNRGLAVKADNELESNDRGDALNGGVHVSSHSSIPLHGQSSTPQQCAPPCAPRPSDIPDSSKELVMASHDKEELSEKYSIGECMDILDAMGAEVGERAYMEAVERFRDRDWREIFFRFPTERRKQWLRRLEHRN